MEKPTLVKFAAVFVFVGSFIFYKEWMRKTAVTIQEAPVQQSGPDPVEETEPAFAPVPSEAPVVEAPAPVEEQPVAAAPEPEPSEEEKKLQVLHSNIYKYSKMKEMVFEDQVRELLKKHNHEEYFNQYLAIKQERNSALKDHFKNNISQRGLYEFNVRYHNKLSEVFGRDLYKEYLLLLKATNDRNGKTKPAVVLEI